NWLSAILAAKGCVLKSKLYSSRMEPRANVPLRAKRTVKLPSTGQSFLGVKRSWRSLTQNHVPAILGEMSIPVETAFSTCCSGAADSAKSTTSGEIEEMPL